MQNKYTKHLDYLPHSVKTNYVSVNVLLWWHVNSDFFYFLLKCVSLIPVFPVGLLEPAECANLTVALISCTVIGWDCVQVKLSSVTLVRFALLTDLMIRKLDAFLERCCLFYTSQSCHIRDDLWLLMSSFLRNKTANKHFFYITVYLNNYYRLYCLNIYL